jgi:hypothetical protein
MRTSIAFATIAAMALSTAHADPIIEGENGQRYEIHRTERLPGGSEAVVLFVLDTQEDVIPSLYYMFDCHGHMINFSEGSVNTHPIHIPPRSVASRIAQIACRQR